MRVSPALCSTVAIAMALAVTSASKGATTSSKPDSALIASGKKLIATQRCNGCHNADLKGKPGFSPSLLPTDRPMSHYTQAQFVRLLTTGIDDDGKKIGPPMSVACKQTPADSKAIFAYLKNLK